MASADASAVDEFATAQRPVSFNSLKNRAGRHEFARRTNGQNTKQRAVMEVLEAMLAQASR